jgi:hypothetical protein
MVAEGIPVEVACRVLDVSTSGYFAWRSPPPSQRSVRHAWPDRSDRRGPPALSWHLRRPAGACRAAPWPRRSMPLVAITQYEVRAWVTNATRQELAASTVRRAYQLLGKVMGVAVDAGMIAQNPCRRVPLPRIDRREMRFLTPAEVARLADSIRPGYRALCCLVPMVAFELARWLGFAAAASTWTMGWWRSWRSSRRSAATCISGRPRPGLATGWPGSGIASGGRQPGRPGWMGCASTTCGIRRWRCGSPPRRIPRRSPLGPDIPR